jgi:hypothetical protein
MLEQQGNRYLNDIVLTSKISLFLICLLKNNQTPHQCWGSVTFCTDPDPDPDPAIFVSSLQDGN